MRKTCAALAATSAAMSVMALAACGDDDGGSGPLAAQLRDTGLTLYLPELAGRLPAAVVDGPEPGVEEMEPAPPSAAAGPQEQARPARVEVAAGSVVVTYTREGTYAYELVQQPVPERPLCRAVSQIAGSACAESGGVMRSTMEELATVAVVRDDTLLVLRDLVVETRPDIVEAAVTILQEAPVATPEQLAAVGG